MEAPKRISDYPYWVVCPSRRLLERWGFGNVAHLLFIMNGRPGHQRIANRFLIGLAIGEWSVGIRGLEQPSTVPPTKATMHNYAHWLVNYLEYCHVRGKYAIKANYKIDLIHGHQPEMSAGSWSRGNTGLAAMTVDLRIEVACMFLQWAFDKKLREPFHIPKVRKSFAVESRETSGAPRTKTVETRHGKVRESKRRLGFPDEREIAAWLSRVREKCADLAMNSAFAGVNALRNSANGNALSQSNLNLVLFV